MQTAQSMPTRKLEPEALGPLEESGIPETGAHDLFPGESRYLGKSALKKRGEMWARLTPRLGRLLEADEKVLYAAPAVQKVSILAYLGMGWLAFAYHQVFLVATDRRLLEVILDFRGRQPEQRVRSFPWKTCTKARYRLGSLTLTPEKGKGKAQSWSLRARGDKKVMKRLIPRIEEQLLTGDPAAGEMFSAVHCPKCATALPPKPTSCRTCKTLFRSGKLAALLSLAFPGAGLWYVGHPVLATFDFLGEVGIYVLVLSMLAVSTDPITTAVSLLFGGFLLFCTKAESLHMGHILLARRQSESNARRGRFRKMAIGGGIVSVLGLVAALALTGQLATMVDRELDFAAAGQEWYGSRDPAEWQEFADDPSLRSQWVHEEGWVVSVFAYDLGPGGSLEGFRRDYVQQVGMDGISVLREDSELTEPFAGFRTIRDMEDSGTLHSFINYFLYDEESNDVHQLLAVVPAEYADEGEQQLQDLMEGAEWMLPVPGF